MEANISSYVAHALDELERSAEEIGIEPEREELILKRLLRKNVGFQSVSSLDLEGDEKFRVDRFQLVTVTDLRNVSTNDSYQSARRGIANVGDVFVSPEFEPRTTVSVPLYHLGELRGVLLAELNLRNLLEVLRTLKIPRGHIYVADRN